FDIFQIVAIALIAVGAYVQIALKDYFDLIEGSFSSAAALLIAVGVIIFFIAFFGCCGAYKENRTCVLIFAGLLIIIFIMEIAGGIAGFVLKGQVEKTVEKYMKDNIKKNATVWDKLQKEFKCCGIHSASDWERNDLPDSCCVTPSAGCTYNNTATYYTKGCLDTFTNWVEDHVYYVGAVGIAFAFIQLVGILFACCLARAIKKEYEVV
ncbi:CD63 antigen-like, partial [Mercenaria mercenaria]|uniref:CD63 antigen-like n=1 Tax=Mercenaria mercenaria TaxID=6596 RepID=UPI00234EC743